MKTFSIFHRDQSFRVSKKGLQFLWESSLEWFILSSSFFYNQPDRKNEHFPIDFFPLNFVFDKLNWHRSFFLPTKVFVSPAHLVIFWSSFVVSTFHHIWRWRRDMLVFIDKRIWNSTRTFLMGLLTELSLDGLLCLKVSFFFSLVSCFWTLQIGYVLQLIHICYQRALHFGKFS